MAIKSTKKRSTDPVSILISAVVAFTFILAAFLNPEFRSFANPSYDVPSMNVRDSSPSFSFPQSSPVDSGRNFSPPVVVPTDVESQLPSFTGNAPGILVPSDTALNGIQRIGGSEFPEGSKLKGSTSGITIKEKEANSYRKVNDFIVAMNQGQILMSVKNPSKTALVEHNFGSVAVSSNGDILMSQNDDLIRVMNLDGAAKVVKVQLNKGGFSSEDPTVAIAPGFELVVSKNKLTRSELRPKDGIARRNFRVLEDGRLAISEFSVESVMNSNDIIADLRQQTSGVAARRIVGDMSKMAAVLNYQTGTQGFTIEE